MNKCKCGGAGEILSAHPMNAVKCKKCGRSTAIHSHSSYAIQAWERGEIMTHAEALRKERQLDKYAKKNGGNDEQVPRQENRD